MSYKLFLDDERKPSDVKWVELPLGPWVIVRNYYDFVRTLRAKGIPEFISFDHDLADEHYHTLIKDNDSIRIPYKDYTEKTGYDCAKFLIDFCIETNSIVPSYLVHSLNSIGKENIIGYIEGYKAFIK